MFCILIKNKYVNRYLSNNLIINSHVMRFAREEKCKETLLNETFDELSVTSLFQVNSLVNIIKYCAKKMRCKKFHGVLLRNVKKIFLKWGSLSSYFLT